MARATATRSDSAPPAAPRGASSSRLAPAALAGAAFVLGLAAPVLPWQLLAVAIAVLALAPWLLADPYRLAVFWVVTSPVLSLFIAFSPGPGRPDVTFDRLMALGLLALLALGLPRRRRLWFGAVDVVLAAFLAAQLLSTLRTEAFPLAQALSTYANIFLLPVVAFWLARQVLAHPRRLPPLLLGLALLGWALGAIGVVEHLLGVRLFPQAQRAAWDDVPGGRAFGPLTNPAIFGAVLAATMPAMVERLRTSHRLEGAVFWSAGLGLALLGAYFTYTRSVWLSVACVLAAYALARRAFGRFLAVAAVGLAAGFLVVASGLYQDPAAAVRAGNEENVVGRWELAMAGWRAFTERPLTGWGFGNLNLYQSLYFESRGVLPSDFALRIVSHNTLVSLLAEGGVVVTGLLAAALALVFGPTVAALARHAHRDSREGTALATLGGIPVAFVVTAVMVDVVYFPYFNLLFWFAAGVLYQTAHLLQRRRAVALRLQPARPGSRPAPAFVS